VCPISTVVLLTDVPTNLGQFVPLRYYFGPEVKLVMMTRALEQLANDPRSLGATAWTIVEFRDGRPKASPARGMAAPLRSHPVGLDSSGRGVNLLAPP
jgi:hypothetical protein